MTLELDEFFRQMRARILDGVKDRIESGDVANAGPERVFADIVMEHLADAGICEEANILNYDAKVGNANVRMNGYALDDEATQLDLFVNLFVDAEERQKVTDSAIQTVARQGMQLLLNAARGRLSKVIDRSHPAHNFVLRIESIWKGLDQVRIFVITDGQSDKARFSGAEVEGKLVAIEVMDIGRLHRHIAAGKPRDEIVLNFVDAIGAPLACVYVPDPTADYDFALTALPGDLLRALYERYSQQLLEANVRSFLGVTGKHNKGIVTTLREEPEHFMAFNNGLVIVGDEARFERNEQGEVGIAWLKGFQIVNGGQTTASIYFAKRKNPEIDLSHVRVPAKIIVMHEDAERDKLISNISRYANSQNAVKNSDLSANRPFHIQLENLANSTYLPDAVGLWFYERTAGGYNVLLSLRGSTPAKLRKLKEVIPPSRKLSKNDVAKYVQAWRLLPHIVSLGGEKNFKAFMDDLDASPDIVPSPLDVKWYMDMIAKAIIFRTSHSMVKRMFPQGQANVAAYLVSVVSERLGNRLDLTRIWNKQALSDEFKKLLADWAQVVFNAMAGKAAGKQIPEFAKRPECWEHVRAQSFDLGKGRPPEIKA
jgi:hypothetical protein